MNLVLRNLVLFILISNAIVLSFGNNIIRLDHHLFFILFITLVINKNFYIPKNFLLYISIFFLIGLITSIVYGSNISGVAINYMALVFIVSILYSLFKIFDKNIIFDIYCKAAKISIFFGFVQFFSFLITSVFSIDLTFLFDFRWILASSHPSYTTLFLKLSSIFTEPSYFAPFILPYLIFTFYSFNEKKSKRNLFNFLTTLVVFLFTFSTVGYVSLILYVILNQSLREIFSIKKMFIIAIFLIIVFFVPEMYDRLSDFSYENIEQANLSTLSYLINLDYFVNLLDWKMLIGYGIDSYQILMNFAVENNLSFIDYTLLHEKFSYSWEGGTSSIEEFQLNGSPSMFLRLPLEFGIIASIYFLWNFKKKYVSNLFFAGILAYSLRSGQYLRFDMILFVFMCIYNFGFYNFNTNNNN